jgi:hypothetical protein
LTASKWEHFSDIAFWKLDSEDPARLGQSQASVYTDDSIAGVDIRYDAHWIAAEI